MLLGLLGASTDSEGVSPAAAAIAQPEIQASTRLQLQGHPSVFAVGPSVLGTWLAGGSDSGGVDVGVSTNGGNTWSWGTSLPVTQAALGSSIPTATFISNEGSLHVAAESPGGAVQYFRGAGLAPIVWAPLQYGLLRQDYNLLGFELHSVATSPGGGLVYLCSTENTEDNNYSSTVMFTRSLDGGMTWQTPLRLSSPYSKGSSMVVDADGQIFVAWVDYSLSQVLLCKSMDQGVTWSPPVAAGPMNDNLLVIPLGLQDPISPPRNYPWYRTILLAPNFPALAVDRSTSPTRGALYITWADHAEGEPAPPTQTLFETQPNESPAEAQVLPMNCEFFGSVTDVETGTDPWDYYALDLVAGQTVHLDGQSYNEAISPTLWMPLPDGSLAPVGYLRFLRDLDVPDNGQRKAMVFTAPRTGRYYVQASTTFYGTGYRLLVRDFTPSPASAARDMRDIVLVRSADGGATWSPKQRVNQDTPGHDQCMPNVAVDGRGIVHVAWYDRRDAPDGDRVWAYASNSGDGGLSFGPDLRLSSVGSPWIGAQNPHGFVVPGDMVGDRIAIAGGDDYGLVAWADFRGWPARSDIYTARIVDVPTATLAVSDLLAEAGPGGVRVQWLVNDARAVSALRVHRRGEGEAERVLGEGDIVPTRSGRLEFLDESAEPGRTYTYRLEVRTTSGVSWLGPVEATTPERISALAWRSAWPNPFGRSTSIKLAVPRQSEGAVRVYDVQGKEVRTLAEGRFEPGERTLDWDGRDAAGNATAAGIYFVSAQVGGESARMRVARVP